MHDPGYIGDFAEGVPFHEWQHWRQFAVEPPTSETLRALGQEVQIPNAVNLIASELDSLNDAFLDFAAQFGVELGTSLWHGSLDSLAGRQLKWVYPASATDDEFLKRATLASTLVLDTLDTPGLRKVPRQGIQVNAV